MSRLVDRRAVADWPFREQYSSVMPQDLVGELDDLTVPTGITRPEPTQGTPSGWGREFIRSSTTGFWLEDDTGQLKLTRNLAIIMLLEMQLEDLANGNDCDIIQRGRGGASDPVSFCVRLSAVDVVARTAHLALLWQQDDGTDVEDTGVTFTWPLGDFLLIAVVREVIDEFLTVRYQINGESALGDQNHALNCGGEESAELSVGMGMDGVAYQNHFDGIIDTMQVLDEAVLPDEFKWNWERISIDQPAGVEMMRRLVPPGVYSTDPDTAVQRELAVEGQAFGHAKSLARRLKYYFLPPTCFGEMLERWEEITGHSPKPGDDLAKRRNRVLSFTNTQRGFPLEDIKAQLAEAFDQDAVDVEVLEYDNDYANDFTTLPDDSIVETGGATWSIVSGTLQATTSGGPADMRFPSGASWQIWSLCSGDGASVGVYIDTTLSDPDTVLCGLMLGSMSAGSWVFIGIHPDGVDGQLVWMKYVAGVLDDSFTVIDATFAEEAYLFLYLNSDGTIAVRVGTDLDDARTQTPVATIDPDIGICEWAGVCMVSPNLVASVGDEVVQFDDFFTRTPQGHQRFNWYGYRDPLLPGNPDIEGARLIVRRIKPAHTRASACTVTSLKCDDPGNGCEQAPLGK